MGLPISPTVTSGKVQPVVPDAEEIWVLGLGEDPYCFLSRIVVKRELWWREIYMFEEKGEAIK